MKPWTTVSIVSYTESPKNHSNLIEIIVNIYALLISFKLVSNG